LDQVPLYVRGGSILPSTVAMNHVGEKPWDPLRFDVYPDATGAATGSLYEDDGVSPAYRTGAFRRTNLHLSASASGSILTLDAPIGPYQPPARNFEFILHSVAAGTVVQLDGRPLSEIAPASVTTGWWRDAAGTVMLRLPDDGRGHTLALR
jgi:hypothetical protein